MRDIILVERVIHGKWCDNDCPMFVENRCSEWVCIGPGEGNELEFDGMDGYYRCSDCLATPSAVVVTPDMMQAVTDAVAMCNKHEDEHGHYHRFVSDALRAAFPQIKEATK